MESENRKDLSTKKEDEINDIFRNALHYKKYSVSDQSRGGESQTSKSVGERDFVIRNNNSQITESVIEAFILKSYSETVIKKHYDKLLNKYDTVGNKCNFILVYSQVEKFNELWKKYINNLHTYVTAEFDSYPNIEQFYPIFFCFNY